MHDSKYFQPDSRWPAFGYDNLSDFLERLAPGFLFKEQVAEDVIKEWETIQYLIAHAYYKYQFIDVALDKAILSMEMAFKIRYREITGTDWPSKKPLAQLILDLHERNLFDTSLEQLERFRWFRNHRAHLDRHSFMGSMGINMIERVANTINEIYDDVDLRLLRRKLESAYSSYMYEKKGVIRICFDKALVLLHELTCFLIDNKQSRPVYHFIFTPVYDLQPYQIESENGYDVPESHFLAVTGLQLEDNVMIGSEIGSNTVVEFHFISDQQILTRHEAWVDELNQLQKSGHPNLVFNPLVSRLKSNIQSDFVLREATELK